MKIIISLFRKIISPKSDNDDSRRKEYILNLLLFGLLAVCLGAILISFAYYILGKNITSFPSLFFVSIVIFVLIYLSNKGYFKISSYCFVAILYLSCLSSASNFGIDVPQTLLIFALIIAIAGIVISTKAAITTTTLIGISLITLQLLHQTGLVQENREWRMVPVNMGDAILLSITYFIIAIVSWISNKEIEKSFQRAKQSEAALLEERDKLEINVEKRTKELKIAQLNQLAEMSRFAEFGKLTTGVIHDLVNPLTAISLCLRELKTNKTSNNLQGAEYFIKEALAATNKMENFISNARKQMSMAEVKKQFDIAKEIKESVSLLNFKAREKRVKFIFQLDKNIDIYGNPLKFSQVINNLVNNSIDAFPSKLSENTNNEVVLSCNTKGNSIHIVISDNGPGIEDEILDKVFDSYFTTKEFDKGTGIGLAIVKDVVENNFNGKIGISSNSGGTSVSIVIPKLREKNE